MLWAFSGNLSRRTHDFLRRGKKYHKMRYCVNMENVLFQEHKSVGISSVRYFFAIKDYASSYALYFDDVSFGNTY